ncbi:cation:proton antiporter [Chloroflexota bacterium]
METNLVLAIGTIIVIGFVGGMLTEKIKFPRITGYLIIGIVMSPSLLNIISAETIESLDIITNIALGVIAFLIGGSLHLDPLRRLGKSISWITPFQSVGAWIIVTILLAFLAPLILGNSGTTLTQIYFPLAIIIGAISSATAPAATMAIIHEYKASGPFTTTLLAIVALDDAIAVVAFALAITVGKMMMDGTGSMSLYEILVLPVFHIMEAITIGVFSGFMLIYIARMVKSSNLKLIIVFGMIMLCSGTAEVLGVSSILANMASGFIVINISQKQELFFVVERIEDILYAMFFVLAGLHFDLGIIKIAGVLAVLIVVSRYAGKYFGTMVGATIAHASSEVRKYLGFALLPQAGVALGLSLIAKQTFPAFGDIVVNAILASVIINEIITPSLTKYAILKSGEANPGEIET